MGQLSMVYNIFHGFNVILLKQGFIFLLISFCLIRAETDQLLDQIGVDPENPIPDEDIALLEEIFLLSPKNQGQLIQKLSELSILTTQDNYYLKKSKTLSELAKNPDVSETLIIILTQLSKQKPIKNDNGWIKQTITETNDFRYRWIGWIRSDVLQGGFSVERDPGEHNIIDGYSGFVEGKFSNGRWIFGDHQIISGFGLISWRTFPVTKSFEAVSSISRMGKGLASYKSSHESWGYRGVGLTWESRLGEWLVSLSQNLHDGEMDSIGILSITDTGDHSSYSSIERKNNLTESVLISRWMMEKRKYSFGFMSYTSLWSEKNQNKNKNMINSVSFSGQFKGKVFIFFGEAAWEGTHRKKIFLGVKLPVYRGLYLLSFRHYDGIFQTYRSNPIGEWSNKGETGIFQGLTIKLGKNRITVFSDIFGKNQEDSLPYFKTMGIESGFRWEIRHTSYRWRIQWKQSWKSNEDNYYYLPTGGLSFQNSESVKGTFYYSKNDIFTNKLEISSTKFENDLNYFRSVGVQEKITLLFKIVSVEVQWIITQSDDFASRLYFWDVNLPGEMRNRVFSYDSHSPAVKCMFYSSSSTRIGMRYRLIWEEFSFHSVPHREGAFMIEASF